MNKSRSISSLAQSVELPTEEGLSRVNSTGLCFTKCYNAGTWLAQSVNGLSKLVQRRYRYTLHLMPGACFVGSVHNILQVNATVTSYWTPVVWSVGLSTLPNVYSSDLDISLDTADCVGSVGRASDSREALQVNATGLPDYQYYMWDNAGWLSR